MRVLHHLVKKFVYFLFTHPAFKQCLKEEVQNIVYNEPMVIGPRDRLHMSSTVGKNNFLVNTNSGDVWINDYVFFGKNVCLVTGTHDYSKFDEERIKSYPREGNDIIIQRGAWIATNATILGPCVVGQGAVVAAGSVVTNDVPPYTVVAGVPAKVVKTLPTPSSTTLSKE